MYLKGILRSEISPNGQNQVKIFFSLFLRFKMSKTIPDQSQPKKTILGVPGSPKGVIQRISCIFTPGRSYLILSKFKMSKTMPKDPQFPETNIDGSQGGLIFTGPGSTKGVIQRIFAPGRSYLISNLVQMAKIP